MPPSPLVKICGLTCVGDAVQAAEAGADWLGLNFHPPSPRSLSIDRASEMLRALPGSVEPVGLFVDRSASEIREICGILGLRTVQLHGVEPPESIAELIKSGLRVVKAFRLGDYDAIADMSFYLETCERIAAGPYAVLVDAYVPGRPGGTGVPISWAILDELPPIPRLILAGGLNPTNLRAMIRRVRPWMVDVAGGVESAPGRKDPELVAAFIQEARGAASAGP